MNTSANRVAVVAGAAAAAVLTILGLTLDWAVWVWLPLAVVLGAGSAIMLRSAFQSEELTPPATAATAAAQHHVAAPPRPTVRSATVSGLPLPSDQPDYRFLFSATVCWERQPHVPELGNDAAAAAKQLVVTRAVELTRRYPPENHALASVHLSSTLSERASLANGHVVWATEVTLTLSKMDLSRLEEMAGLRKDRVLWNERRTYERNARDFVGKEVLRDPGTALLWWFGRHLDSPDLLARTVPGIDDLRQLTAAAHATDVPPWPPNAVAPPDRAALPAGLPHAADGETAHEPAPPPAQRLADSVGRLMDDSEPALRAVVYRCLAELFAARGFPEIADDFQRRSDTPDATKTAEPGERRRTGDPRESGSSTLTGPEETNQARPPDDNGS